MGEGRQGSAGNPGISTGKAIVRGEREGEVIGKVTGMVTGAVTVVPTGRVIG